MVHDFEVVAEMPDDEYEKRMKVAREQVDELEDIYTKNEYRPLLQMAEEERSKAVDLLNDVKEKFGGGETTGRCHSNREEKTFNHRLMPANKENFDFSPVSVTDIDSDGNPIEKIDNSHIYDNNLYDSESDSEIYPDEYDEYDENEDGYLEPPLVAPDENDEIRPEEILDNKEDLYGFEISDAQCPADKVFFLVISSLSFNLTILTTFNFIILTFILQLNFRSMPSFQTPRLNLLSKTCFLNLANQKWP